MVRGHGSADLTEFNAMTAVQATADAWWKNAVFYCLDVKTFLDSNGDGIGDFRGATQKVDYLAGLGISCIWLQPFYPSPQRDNGYDITDYYSVDPRFGTLGDFVEFVRAASERGIRVIADLVVNHTSNEHPWFQQARDTNSPYHDFYVWSDKKPPHAEKGIVFPGEQDSIWSYETTAQQWYMHRFYDFQPDLNINNARVRDEIQRVMGFWLELGLSGFRVDAVPFLIEELPGIDHPAVKDPHDYLRELRAFLSRRRGDAVLLAEANVSPKDLELFLGDKFGDQMQVLFDFIGNQNMWLAVVRGDARPIERALKSRPIVPPFAQFATFVKNHDELTLDKLTPKERDEVFAALAPDPNMRSFGRGIRRRAPTMLDGDRERMELVYSLAFSLPGSPVLLYGEEIGLGDDLSLAGRDSVRTAMQWIGDPGAGFSTAPREAMWRPPVDDGPFGYRRVNVERERQKPKSWLNWMERLIRTRREWPEFGWGEWTIVRTGDPAVLVLEYEWEVGQTLVVHNVSKRRVSIDVALPRHRPHRERGRWHHLFGAAAKAPGITQDRLRVDLGAYEYHWFGHREGP
jgi:maltose alpha-D-glucosyltransferase/alpha-amylase